MSETKYIPFSELKPGMEIRGYKKGNCETYCFQEVKSIKDNSVTLSWKETLENASDYKFEVELTEEELEEKIKELENKN